MQRRILNSNGFYVSLSFLALLFTPLDPPGCKAEQAFARHLDKAIILVVFDILCCRQDKAWGVL